MPAESATASTARQATLIKPECVGVLIPLPLRGAYDYAVPADLTVDAGDYVRVPLGSREVTGVVWGPGAGDVSAGRLKPIAARLDIPPMPAVLRQMVDWVAGYTLSTPGAVLRMAMSVPTALMPPKPRVGYRLADALPDLRMTAARQRVLRTSDSRKPRPVAEIARAADVGPAVVRGLIQAGALSAVELSRERTFPVPDTDRRRADLSPAQAAAAANLVDRVKRETFSVSLLDGVTGAGKTEVYFEAIAAALGAGRQALVMLPEIALSVQWLQRFEDRFGARPVEWHSDLPQSYRRAAWRAAANGSARLVVGARSALFLPYPDLGLIVVDEEHEGAFKQEDGVIYHARDMAVVRARLGGFTAVLASATPSLETVANVERGRYERIELPARHGGARLPEIAAIDMRTDPPPRQNWLSPPLRQALTETFEQGEQAMLFLNRRGYAPLTLCRVCGHRLQCPHCTAWLVEHRFNAELQCHHCGFAMPLPMACPKCEAEESFAACGPGVERLAEEVAGLFPRLRTEVMSSDTLIGPGAAQDIVRRVQAHKIDLLIGTQIVAKGHHFPKLTLVGVVDADLGLTGGDLRAAERTYQVLHQVAGRAGREDRPGRVYLQTYMPESPVLQALVAGDRDGFIAAEAESRRRAGMPPYGRLAALIVASPDAARADETAAALGRAAPHGSGLNVLGPAPAPLAVLRGRHRRRLLLKASKETNVQAVLRAWLARVRWHGNVRVQVDVDPYSFL